jgi:tetratricopeptide (TPR) repeat protein
MNDFFTLAVRDFEAAIALRPQLSVAHAALISIAMARGESERAAALLNEGLDAAPASWMIRWRYLESLLPGWSGNGTTEAALAAVAKYLASVENAARRQADLSSLLGFADYVSGRMLARAEANADAVRHFSRALGFGQAWQYELALGRSYSDNGQYVLALRSFDAALALSPGRMEIKAERAWTYEAMASHANAVAVWDELLAVRPMDPTILHAKARVLRAEGQYDEAKEAWDKAVFYGAYDAAIRAERGSLLLNELEDEQAALEDLRVATTLESERAQYWLEYGIALTLANQCDAVAALATYLERCEDGAELAECDLDQRTWATRQLRRMESAQCEGG